MLLHCGEPSHTLAVLLDEGLGRGEGKAAHDAYAILTSVVYGISCTTALMDLKKGAPANSTVSVIQGMQHSTRNLD